MSGRVNIAPGEPGATLHGSIITSNQKDRYLSVTKNGSTLTVTFDLDTHLSVNIRTDVTMDISLPSDAAVNLKVSGASADTNISGFELKDVRLETASGRTAMSGCSGSALHIGSVSGRIDVDDVQFNDIDAGCVSGSIDVKNASGAVTAHSTSGTVRITNAAGDISVSNTSGSVFVTQQQKDIGHIHVNVISGGIELMLNPDAAFNLAAQSTSGGLNTDYDITVSGSMSKKIVGTDISGKVNGGGANIDLSTVSGGIRVLKSE